MGKNKPKISSNDLLRGKAQALLAATTKVYYETLDFDGTYMPYADERILKVVLNQLGKLGLTTPEKIKNVLQYLPKNSEYLEE